MIIITASKTKNLLTTPAGAFPISFRVRTDENGRLKKICYSVPDKKPCKPLQFPNGRYEVLQPFPRETAYLAPFFVLTDATQKLDVWKVVDNKYVCKTGEEVTARAYGLHYSALDYTDGCIRFISKDDLITFVEWRVRTEGQIFLDVVE